MKEKLFFAVVATALASAAAGGTYLYKQHHYGEDGYNGFGFDREGYDRKGFDKDGFDKDGYDTEGFHRDTQRDKDGYDRRGYRDGFDRDGKDIDGFYRNGYNSNVVDRSDNSVEFYRGRSSEMHGKLQRAEARMKEQELDYALHDIRIGLEIGVKCIILHLVDESCVTDVLDDNITVCKRKELLPRELIENLYDAKNHCNDEQHDTGVFKTYGQVYFSFKVLEELYGEVERICGCADAL